MLGNTNPRLPLARLPTMSSKSAARWLASSENRKGRWAPITQRVMTTLVVLLISPLSTASASWSLSPPWHWATMDSMYSRESTAWNG